MKVFGPKRVLPYNLTLLENMCLSAGCRCAGYRTWVVGGRYSIYLYMSGVFVQRTNADIKFCVAVTVYNTSASR